MFDFRKNYPKILLGLFTVIWIILAINPPYRRVWVAENLLSMALVIVLILTYKYFKFSNTSYTLLFIFLTLHTIGAHYTYAEMPLFTTIKNILGLSRNHYDRVVHFLFGLLFYLPVYEIMTLKLKLKGARAHILTILSIFALKGIYEVLEYFYALVEESGLSQSLFLGAQGDIWDAQKDMLLGLIGSLVSCFSTIFCKKIYRTK